MNGEDTRHADPEGAERFPNATLTELPGVGHFPQLETPELVAQAIARHAGA